MLGPAQELNFWTGIMRDHTEFILGALSFRETQFLQTAQYYKNVFIQLNNEANSIVSGNHEAVLNLANKVQAPLTCFINFKRLILNRLLQCNIEISLPPTFVNHMINEAMNFNRVLCEIMGGPQANSLAENIALHKLWLPDAAGHAATISSNLDPTETKMIKEAEEFKNSFEHLYIKAVELGMMLERACLEDGALARLNDEATELINKFIIYLCKVLGLRKNCSLLGVIKPLMADHMIREEEHYLSNIAIFMKY